MDIRKVKKLIELLQESGIAEIEIKEGEESVRISRMPPGGAAPPAQAFFMPSAAAAMPMAMPGSDPAAAARPMLATPPASPNAHNVTAPMVGTYYAAPSPGAKAFVSVGDEIKVGQVLCIIEAMKMMNQIESERTGRVASILVSNGDPVEYGQPLFVLE